MSVPADVPRPHKQEQGAQEDRGDAMSAKHADVGDPEAAVVSVDEHWWVVSANDAATRLAGAKVSLQGSVFWTVFPHCDVPTYRARAAHAMGTREPIDFAWHGMAERAFQVHIEPNETGLTLAHVPLVERRRTPPRDQETFERIEAIVRATPMPVYLWEEIGDDFVLIEYSDAAIGASHGEVRTLLGARASTLYPPENRAPLDRLRRAVATGEPVVIEEEMEVLAHGGRHWAKETTVRVAPHLVATYVEDIQARRMAEEALARSEARYRAIFNLSPEIIVVHIEGTIAFANPSAVRAFAAPSESALVGRSLHELARDEFAAPSPMSATTLRSQGSPPATADFRRLDGTGDLVLDMTSLPFEYEGEQAVLTIARDVTEQKRLEEQLRRSHRFEALGQIAGGIAHDYNNVLSAIFGFSKLVLDRVEHEPQLRDDVVEIVKAAERAAALTRQLLAFSRRQPLHTEPLDVNAVLHDVEKLMRRVLGEHIVLAIRYANESPIIAADRGQLEQVILNLAVNARDAMPEGGVLTIETRTERILDVPPNAQPEPRPGRYAIIEVGDSGTGMDQETLTKVFEPFFTTKSASHGTGLGLAAVYGIVEQSGGFVRVESAPGEGSRFAVAFPLADASTERATPARSATPTATPAGESILLVEDESAVRAATRRVLEDAGYRVVESKNGVDALARVQDLEERVDLVIADLVMPEVGGAQLVRLLKSYYGPDMPPVVVLTGYVDSALFEGDELRDATILAKPVVADELLRRVAGKIAEGRRS
jgi:two-component system, cell cycle sensor histidine kinase and response regulator CckA